MPLNGVTIAVKSLARIEPDAVGRLKVKRRLSYRERSIQRHAAQAFGRQRAGRHPGAGQVVTPESQHQATARAMQAFDASPESMSAARARGWHSAARLRLPVTTMWVSVALGQHRAGGLAPVAAQDLGWVVRTWLQPGQQLAVGGAGGVGGPAGDVAGHVVSMPAYDDQVSPRVRSAKESCE